MEPTRSRLLASYFSHTSFRSQSPSHLTRVLPAPARIASTNRIPGASSSRNWPVSRPLPGCARARTRIVHRRPAPPRRRSPAAGYASTRRWPGARRCPGGAFQRAHVLPPRSVIKLAVSGVVQVIEIQDRAEFHVLELVHDEQGESRRVRGQRGPDSAECVPGGRADVTPAWRRRHRHEHGQAGRDRGRVAGMVARYFLPGVREPVLPLGGLGLG